MDAGVSEGRIGNEAFINAEECRTVQNGKERCPFLEKDVDELVRDYSRWSGHSLVRLEGRDRDRTEKGIGLEGN
jgi:hypothetical protein